MNFQALASVPLPLHQYDWHYTLRDEVELMGGSIRVTGGYAFEVRVPKYDVNFISAMITEIVPPQYRGLVVPLTPKRLKR